jgi:DNA (cytosine-5)-methyltransferase 1
MIPELRHGSWRLSSLDAPPEGSPTVFSCFHCGGGSTMGYKLAGFNVLGGVDIDPQMVALYRANHKPRFSYQMSVRDLLKHDLPAELYALDVLDGSPPCSSFSTAGSRDKDWGKQKVFREGQAAQRLDDLFFDFIDIAAALRPKVVIAENVKGLVIGKAKGYVKEIFAAFKAAGYDAQLFLLNASRMGVPQRRERTFFIARRRDLALPKIALEFNEDGIPFDAIKSTGIHDLTPAERRALPYANQGDINLKSASRRLDGAPKMFTSSLIWRGDIAPTVTSSWSPIVAEEERHMANSEIIAVQTFPVDYNFCGVSVNYVCGMSVPPYMMQRVASEVRRQLLGLLEPA